MEKETHNSQITYYIPCLAFSLEKEPLFSFGEQLSFIFGKYDWGKAIYFPKSWGVGIPYSWPHNLFRNKHVIIQAIPVGLNLGCFLVLLGKDHSHFTVIVNLVLLTIFALEVGEPAWEKKRDQLLITSL